MNEKHGVFYTKDTVYGKKVIDCLRPLPHSFLYSNSFLEIQKEQWDELGTVFVDAVLILDQKEHEFLNQLQKSNAKPIVFLLPKEYNRQLLTKCFLLRPALFFVSPFSGKNLSIFLNFQMEIKSLRSVNPQNLFRDPMFLFFTNLSHELRDLLNGLSAMIKLFSEGSLSFEQKEYLKTLQISQDNILTMLDKWSELTLFDESPVKKNEKDFSFVEISKSTQAFFEKITIFDRPVMIWNSAESEDSWFLGDNTKIQQLFVFFISFLVKVFAFKEVRFVFATEKNEDGVFLLLTSEVFGTCFRYFLEKDNEMQASLKKDLGNLFILKSLFRACDASLLIQDDEIEPGRSLPTVSSASIVGKATDDTLAKNFVFRLFIPVKPSTKQKEKTNLSEKKLPESMIGKKIQILLAEDDRISQKLTTLLIQKKGWNIRVVENGIQALKEMQENNYDLILMDVQMPVMDGLEATKRIRIKEQATRKHIPIIALTAHAMKGDKEVCILSGMDAYLTKPIIEEELYSTVLQVWAKYSQPYTFLENPPADLNRIISLLDGNKEDLKGLIVEFIHYFPEQVGFIRKSLSDRNSKELERTAHKLKGSLSNFEARRCYELTSELERLGRSQSLTADTVAEAAGELFQVLILELERLKEYLQNFE